jgi:hypothetical protein
MTRRLVFWVSCVVVLVVFACKSEPPRIPMGPACSGYATTVVVLGDHRYLYIQYSDGSHPTLVRLDEKPRSNTDAVLNYVCPCELDECKEMCAQAARQVGHASACLVGPETVSHPHAAPAPDPAPSKPATPPQP